MFATAAHPLVVRHSGSSALAAHPLITAHTLIAAYPLIIVSPPLARSRLGPSYGPGPRTAAVVAYACDAERRRTGVSKHLELSLLISNKAALR